MHQRSLLKKFEEEKSDNTVKDGLSLKIKILHKKI